MDDFVILNEVKNLVLSRVRPFAPLRVTSFWDSPSHLNKTAPLHMFWSSGASMDYVSFSCLSSVYEL